MKTGNTVSTAHFVVFHATSPHDQSRLGTIVSRKVGRANQRNKIKRFLREIFRNRRSSFLKPVDLVILAKKQASFERITHAAIVQELEQAFVRCRVLENPSR